MTGYIGRGAGRAAVAAAALFAVVAAAGAAWSQNSEQWAGTLLGGIAGGMLGSEIGKGQGREIAIGAGALLGGMTGRYLAGRSGSAPAPAVAAPCCAPPPRAHWRQPRARERVTVYERIYEAPPEPRNIATRGGARSAARAHRDTFASCQMLEDGLAPVYACRTPHGDWKILR